MTAIDTNVVIRFVTRDNEDQFEAAQALLHRADCYLPITVVLESVWVLENVYQYPPADVAWGMRQVAGLPNVQVGRVQAVETALTRYEAGFDFADALHLALVPPEVDRFATFDAAFIQQAADDETPTPVVQPSE